MGCRAGVDILVKGKVSWPFQKLNVYLGWD